MHIFIKNHGHILNHLSISGSVNKIHLSFPSLLGFPFATLNTEVRS